MPNPNYDIRMVALDLDGTLLSRHHQVTPRTVEAVCAAIRRGVVVLPATGRGLNGVPFEVAAIPGVRYALTANGASVWDLGADPVAAVYSRYADPGAHPTTAPRCLLRRLLPAATSRAVLEVYRRFSGDISIFFNGCTVKSEAGARWSQARIDRALSTEARQAMDGRFFLVPDLGVWLDAHGDEVEKFCMFFERMEDVAAAKAAFAALDGIELVQGSPDNVEVTAAGVDKGEALLALGAQLGIRQEQILAIGDSDNDRAMLQKAGVAAVMANGMPSVRALADIVSENDCDHDGVAELLERLIG